jgi:hypothetical protein
MIVEMHCFFDSQPEIHYAQKVYPSFWDFRVSCSAAGSEPLGYLMFRILVLSLLFTWNSEARRIIASQ